RELLIAHVAAKPGGVDITSLDRDFGWARATTARAIRDARSQQRLHLNDDGVLTAPQGT
ncbi:MAG: hypothetical protein H0T72_03375, partial [Chloroflexia bacterium]|nr:hypothetical protein [Chloroflexia bacterium]